MEAAAAVKLPSSAMAFMTRSPAASIMERSYNVTLSAVSTVQLRVMTHKARPRHHLQPRTVREGRRNDEGRTAQRSGPRRWTPTNGVALELALLVAARDAELVVRVEDLDVARRQVRDDDGDLLLVVQAGGVEARLVDRVARDVVVRVGVRGDHGRGAVLVQRDCGPHPVHEGLDVAVVPALLNEVPGPEVHDVTRGHGRVDVEVVLVLALGATPPVVGLGVRCHPPGGFTFEVEGDVPAEVAEGLVRDPERQCALRRHLGAVRPATLRNAAEVLATVLPEQVVGDVDAPAGERRVAEVDVDEVPAVRALVVQLDGDGPVLEQLLRRA